MQHRWFLLRELNYGERGCGGGWLQMVETALACRRILHRVLGRSTKQQEVVHTPG